MRIKKVLAGILSAAIALTMFSVPPKTSVGKLTADAAAYNEKADMIADFSKGESSFFTASDGWSNGSCYDCGWYKQNAVFSGGALNLTIDKDHLGKYHYSGGEYRTKDFYGFGYYETSMQAIKNDGVVSSFTIYTDSTDGNPWDEIDIEVLGKDTTKVQFNYYTGGKGNNEFLYDLGFDASEGFHRYGFDWQPDRITWYVDGKAAYTATNNIPATPGKITMNAWPGITVDDWLRPFDGKTPLTAKYEWVTYQMSLSAQAKENGKCGDNVTWELDSDGVLTISGKGDMYNYQGDAGKSPFAGREDIKSIVIKNGVTSIGGYAFFRCKSLTNATIPDSVTNIYYQAFCECSSLTSITIGNSVTSIGDCAFYWCDLLKEITIPNSVTSIGNGAFGFCSSLKSVNIPDSVTNIGEQVFTFCESLISIIIPDSVTSISDCAFRGCTSLTEITIPNSVTSIGEVAFYECTSLENVIIPDSVTSIGYRAFFDTPWLKEKQKENPLVIVNNILIDGTTCKGDIKIPDSITCIAGDAFYDCTELTNITIPNSVTSIDGGALGYCSSLTEITILNLECKIYNHSSTICNGYDYEEQKDYFNGTIYGFKNSTAQAYADKFKYKFESIGEYVPPTTQPTTQPTTTPTTTTTTTAKPSSTTTKTTTQPIVTNGFEWGRDNWNFKNNSECFTRGSYYISDEYLAKMRPNLSNKEWCAVSKMLGRRWGGSCHGMSATAFLSKVGLMTYGVYTPAADCLYKVASPSKNEEVESLVNYYHLMQVCDAIQQEYRKAASASAEQNLNDIISGLDKNGLVLVGYQQNALGFGGHTVLAYGHESGLWKYGGVNYTERINILDPNFSTEFTPECCIYFNPQTYNWAVPVYKVSTENKAQFNLVVSDTKTVNYGGCLGEPHINYLGDYISGLEIGTSSDMDMSISKVLFTNGIFVNQASSSGDIVPMSFCFSGGSYESKSGYLLRDSESGYRVTQDSYGKMDLKIDYADCVLSADAALAKEIIFDPSGYAEFVGSGSDYSFEMVYNEGFCPTDWYRIQVSGENADRVSLEKTEEGFVLTGSSLSGISVTADNDSHKAQKDFSADCKSVLIYEIDENTIGIKADNDGDGTYESELGETSTDSGKTKVPEGIEPTSYGDTNLDGAINIADVVQLNKFLLNKKDNPIEGSSLANADCMKDGYIDSSDSTLLMNYVSMQITEDKLGSK